MTLNDILKFVFPSRCIMCDEVLPYGNKLSNEYLCDECKKKLEYIRKPTCKKCGAMVGDESDTYCVRCKIDMHDNFISGFGLLRYNDFVKESLHRIKYAKRKEYIYFYGKMIAKMYRERFKKIAPDCFIPVPISKERLRIRNFNQASVLAYTISDELKRYGIDIPVNENIIYRTKNTEVLNKLDNNDRKGELHDAFYVNPSEDIEKVILIDDIYTTGATIDTISGVLKEAGIKDIYFTVITVVDNL
ncbi:MAG: ComF family protein [Lachnospiraceae bacterium]|nr:ComF family protein [Lachnospiraceae bacterium]